MNYCNLILVKKIRNFSFRTYCKYTFERQLEEYRQWDFHMKQLYNFIEETYSDSEILVALVSDHGDNLLDNIKKPPEFLNSGRTQVPLMLRGGINKNGYCEELIENVDLLPIILSQSNIQYDYQNIDGNLPLIFSIATGGSTTLIGVTSVSLACSRRSLNFFNSVLCASASA